MITEDELNKRVLYLEQQVEYLTATLKRIEDALTWDIISDDAE